MCYVIRASLYLESKVYLLDGRNPCVFVVSEVYKRPLRIAVGG